MLGLAALRVAFVLGLRAGGRVPSAKHDRGNVRPESVDVRAAVGHLGNLEDVFDPNRADRALAPERGIEEDAAPDQGVPVLVHGRLGGQQHVGRFIGQGPGALRLRTPLTGGVGHSGVPLPLGARVQSAVLAPEL